MLCKALEGPESQMCASLYYQMLLVAQQPIRSGAGLADSTESHWSILSFLSCWSLWLHRPLF